MPDGLKHTDAFDMELFLSKPVSAQLLEIWLNGRETNGSIAEAKRDISAQGLEIQKARLALSEHVETHVTSQEVTQVRTMWMWFDRLRFLILFALAAQPIEIAYITVHYWT